MGVGDVQLVRQVDDVLRHVDSVRASFQAANDVRYPVVFAELRVGRARERELARSVTDAVIAERELTRLATTEPGLASVRDALRAARAVQGMKRPDLAPIASVRLDLGREIDAIDAWRQVHGMTRAERVAELERMRGIGATDLTTEDWKTFAGIIGDDVDGELTVGMPRAMSSGLPIRDLALNVGSEGPAWNSTSSRLFAGHPYFDTWNASMLPLDERRARVAQLLSGAPEDHTREQWRELAALLHTDGIDVTEHAWFPGIRLDLAARHAYVSGYDSARQTLVRVENASPAQLDGARSELLGSGDLGALAEAVVNRDQLGAVGLTGAAASAVRLRHMLPTSPAAAKSWLQDVQRELLAASGTGPAAQVRDDALALIDRNLARIDGERWWRPLDGYSNHPDYAELGRVRSTYRFLEQVQALATRPAAGAVDGAERLTW